MQVGWRSMQASTGGGSRLSEQNALTVMPWSVAPVRVVRTVTPEAKRPSTERKVSGSRLMVVTRDPVPARHEGRMRCDSPAAVGGRADRNDAAASLRMKPAFSTSPAGTKSPVTPTSV